MNRYPEVSSRVSGTVFVVRAGELGYSVIAFCYVCVLALVVVYLRRKWLEAELGGTFNAKIACGGLLISLWLGWVVLVSGQMLGWNRDPETSSFANSVAVVASLVLTAGALFITRRDRQAAAASNEDAERRKRANRLFQGSEGSPSSDKQANHFLDIIDEAKKVNEMRAEEKGSASASAPSSRPAGRKSVGCGAGQCQFWNNVVFGNGRVSDFSAD